MDCACQSAWCSENAIELKMRCHHCLFLTFFTIHCFNSSSVKQVTVPGIGEKQRSNIFSAERIIEKIQERMRLGFPAVGVKPLVPLKIDNFTQQFEWNVFNFTSTIHHSQIIGLDKFKINFVSFSLRDKSFNFSLLFNELEAKGLYSGKGKFIKFPISGDGAFHFRAINLTVEHFASISVKRHKLQIMDFTGNSKLDQFQSNVTGITGINFVNRFVNRLINFTVPRLFNTNQRIFNLMMAQIVVPALNRILSSFTVLLPSTKLGQVQEDQLFLVDLNEMDDIYEL